MLEVDIRELLDPQEWGWISKEEMGIFTSKGYVFENALSYQDICDGIHLPDIDGVVGWRIFLFAWSDLNIQKNREPGWNFQLQIWGFSGREQIKRENF